LTIGILAQESTALQGRVTDENGAAVVGATLSLVSEKDEKVKYTTSTNAEGEYYFQGLPAGKYFLSAEYKKENKNGVSQTMTIRLLYEHLETVDLRINSYQPIREEVTVIASGTAQTIDEVSKTINIIDARELRDRADFTLAETLRTIPGFRVQQLGGFGRTASVKTRGLRNQDTAVFIDGIRFSDASSITGDA
jgi:outer membrane receptor protein involved in Fe transport